jgi:hypothetical protein
MLGIDPAAVEWIACDLPTLRDLVLIDCPDPDTTEETTSLSPLPSPLSPSSNLMRLRAILPHCDVLLVASTQQKYRSARVADELAAAAPGAHLIFVQTHADTDADIRDDWRIVLESEKNLPSPSGRGAGGEGSGAVDETQDRDSTPNALTLTLSRRERGPIHIFRIDSLQALADAQNGLQPRGEFADLLDLLTCQMAGAAGNRIRRSNFLDLVADTLDACRRRIDEAMPSVRETQNALAEQRGVLAKQIAGTMQAGLLSNRRQWENRLLAQSASRWGLSPFALVLRVYQGIGGLISGALLYRARTPAQMALWGALEGMRTWRKHQKTKPTDHDVAQTVEAFDSAELRKAAIIVEGYAADAELDRNAAQWDTVAVEADSAARGFVARVSAELDSLIARLARRHTGWFTRFMYEMMLLAMLGTLLYRLGKNFFYDSWLSEHPTAVFGLNFYVSAAFWLVLWCLLLLWMFCGRLRRGLRGEINHLAAGWQSGDAIGGIFLRLESDCRSVDRYRQKLEVLQRDIEALRRQVMVGSAGENQLARNDDPRQTLLQCQAPSSQ